MESYLELVSVPAIAAVVYWIIAIIKYAVKENETFKRFIPLRHTTLSPALFRQITWSWRLSSVGQAD